MAEAAQLAHIVAVFAKPLTPPLAPPQGPIERTPEEWAETLKSWGEPAYRALQIFRWIHQRGVMDPSAMTDLSKGLRSKLIEDGLRAPMEVAEEHASEDTTRKLLLRMHDGRDVEAVLIPQRIQTDADVVSPEAEDDEPIATGQAQAPAQSTFTECISSQVGCAMGCVFCASGVAGLKRHLTATEIIGQLLVGRARLGPDERLRNVVFMGMGEPLNNYDAVARALVLITHPEGLNLSRRRVTLSTSGLVPEIDRLGRDFDGQIQLAVSLHQVDDVRRSALMPINRKYPLAELLAALRRYPLRKRRRITIEYTLVHGQNDSLKDADALATLLEGIPVKVNLIPMNPIDASSLGPSSWEAVDAFQDHLRSKRHVATFVRRRKGSDIAAACGQLALKGAKARKLRIAPA